MDTLIHRAYFRSGQILGIHVVCPVYSCSFELANVRIEEEEVAGGGRLALQLAFGT
jgi:hypothetical protein